jgi:hypothetical protein
MVLPAAGVVPSVALPIDALKSFRTSSAVFLTYEAFSKQVGAVGTRELMIETTAVSTNEKYRTAW